MEALNFHSVYVCIDTSCLWARSKLTALSIFEAPKKCVTMFSSDGSEPRRPIATVTHFLPGS